MRIKTVRINNYRVFDDVQIEFSEITAFIGPNGVGKSNILRALDWFFNGPQSSLTEADFHNRDTSKPVQVEVIFTDLSEIDRDALGKYAPSGTQSFTCWRTQDTNGADIRSANSKGFSSFTPIKLASSAAEKKQLYKDLRDGQPDLGLEDAKTAGAIADAMTAWESRNPEYLTDVTEQLETNFFGFNSRGKLRGIFDYVFVGADLRAGEETIDAKSSIIGRILELAVDRTAADDEISNITDDLRAKQQEAYKKAFGDQLSGIASSLNAEIARYSPGHSITVSPSELDIKAPKTTFSVEVVKGSTRTDVEGQGHGFQRTLLVSALQVLAHSGPAGSEGTICLAIEEPELFQHPLQEKAFARVLRELGGAENSQVQIAYATHSPSFVDPQYFDEIRRVTHASDASTSPTVTSTTMERIRDRVSNVIEPEKFSKQVSSVISDRLPVALFAEQVLVVEGTTDAAVILGVGDRLSTVVTEVTGLSVVPAATKRDVVLFSAILSELGIPNYVLFDGDANVDERMRAKNQKASTIQNQMTANAKINRALMEYFGTPPTDFPKTQLFDRFAVFEDILETFLDVEWPEWGSALSKLENESGVQLRKHADSYRLVTSQVDGQIPEFFRDLLKRCSLKMPDDADRIS